MPKKQQEDPNARYVLSDKGREAVTQMTGWGGARSGAGRPRTETLSSPELRFLLWLVEEYAAKVVPPGASQHQEHIDMANKLRRMADKQDFGK